MIKLWRWRGMLRRRSSVSLGTRTVLKLRWLPRRYPSKHSTICVASRASVLTFLPCSSQLIGRIT
ncbi:MAG: hypothetical protein J6386_15310 [Candidatus Synoicihabitans palmerolidicus]|nr:hypothetical protein [Candidatus Synoicihabitans palmerolidicus]